MNYDHKNHPFQVDDKTFSLTVELKLTMTWKDSRVTLNTTRRATNGRVDGSQKLTFPASSQNEIWYKLRFGREQFVFSWFNNGSWNSYGRQSRGVA